MPRKFYNLLILKRNYHYAMFWLTPVCHLTACAFLPTMLRNASYRIPELGSRRGNGRRVASGGRHLPARASQWQAGRESAAEADRRSDRMGGDGTEFKGGIRRQKLGQIPIPHSEKAIPN